MTKDTQQQRMTLANITTYLHGTSIATHLKDDGILVAEFRAIGHTFRFHIDPEGKVVERSCVADHIGLLSRDELNVLCSLVAAEVNARLASLPVDSDSEVIETLENAKRKLDVVLETGQFLSEDERRVLAQALMEYRAGVHRDCAGIQRALCDHTEGIERKLGI